MPFALAPKGWSAIDGADSAAACAVSVRNARGGRRPQVLAVAGVTRQTGRSDTDALRELAAGIDRSLPLVLTLPRSQYRLRVMPEPAVPPREMQSSLRWALGSESDSPPEELELAWMAIPTEALLPARPRQLYAVMTSRPALAARVAGWRQAGMRPKAVDVRETALRNIAALLERPGEGAALLSADADGVGMVFTYQGSLYFDRYIEQPLAELRAADAAARARLHERIAVQVLRSVDVVTRSFPFMPVTRLLLTPAVEELGLAEFLAAQLPLPVERVDLAQLFDLSRVPALSASPALQARCLVALGAALRGAAAAD